MPPRFAVGSLVSPDGGVALAMLIAALFEALVGMGVTVYGTGAIVWSEVYPVFIALVTSPIVGLLIAYFVTVAILNVFRSARPTRANRAFRRLQLISSGFVSFSHGANDAQETTAIITLALFSSDHIEEFVVPTWVAIAAALAIGLGTWAGGWRIIRTMGTRIIRMEPVDGFSAQTVAAMVILTGNQLGTPREHDAGRVWLCHGRRGDTRV